MVYCNTHEWARQEENLVVIGISQYAQENLGSVVFVELPEIGQYFAKSEVFSVLESVKSASEVYAPISGSVSKINERLRQDPQLVNRAAEKEGWLMKIVPDSIGEMRQLMTNEQYKRYIEGIDENDIEREESDGKDTEQN